VIDIPKDVQQARFTVYRTGVSTYPGHACAGRAAPTGARLIGRGETPPCFTRAAAHLGRGAPGAEDFRRKDNIHVATTSWAWAFPEKHRFAPVVGMHRRRYGNGRRPVDLLLGSGWRFDRRVTAIPQVRRHAMIVHIDIDTSEHNRTNACNCRSEERHQLALEGFNRLIAKTSSSPDIASDAQMPSEKGKSFLLRRTSPISAAEAVQTLFD